MIEQHTPAQFLQNAGGTKEHANDGIDRWIHTVVRS